MYQFQPLLVLVLLFDFRFSPCALTRLVRTWQSVGLIYSEYTVMLCHIYSSSLVKLSMCVIDISSLLAGTTELFKRDICCVCVIWSLH